MGVWFFVGFLSRKEKKARRMKRQGCLVYNEALGRMDIRFSLNEYYGGLHCGQTLDVKRGSKWIPTRLEMAKDWFLVEVKTNSIIGLMVRI